MKVKRNNKFNYHAKYKELQDKYIGWTDTNLKLKKIELEDDIHRIGNENKLAEFSHLLSITALLFGLWGTQLLNNSIVKLIVILGIIVLPPIIIKCYDRIQPYQDRLDKQRRELRVELLCVNEAIAKFNINTRSEVKL